MKHYYSLYRASRNFVIGGILLVVSGGLLLAGILSLLWGVPAMVLGCVAIVFGVRGIVTRDKYPLTLGDDAIIFYRRGSEIVVPVSDIEKVWYNTKGIDKRVSIEKKDGEVIDIPNLYGLYDLCKKINKRYGLSEK